MSSPGLDTVEDMKEPNLSSVPTRASTLVDDDKNRWKISKQYKESIIITLLVHPIFLASEE